MTEEQVLTKANEMIDGAAKLMRARVAKAVKFGALDFSDEPDNFRIPRVFLLDALNYAADQYQLAQSDKQGKKDVKNLSHF